MKVIDLLNMIANNEEVPKKIKYKNKIYFRTWSDYMGDEPIDEYYYSEENSWNEITKLRLEDEIEIIEEKPKKIEEIYHCCMESENPEIQVIVDNINFMSDKINELTRKVNYLLEKESDK